MPPLASMLNGAALAPSLHLHPRRLRPPTSAATLQVIGRRTRFGTGKGRAATVRCEGIGIGDFIGGDLLKFDLGQWLSDVEEHKALAIYSPHEGGYEGRYLNRLRYQGYYFLDLSARGLGDPETTLTKIHPVCPVRSIESLRLIQFFFP